MDDATWARLLYDYCGRPKYYRRDGTPIDNGAEVEATLGDFAARRVAEDYLAAPDGSVHWVSTVFLVIARHPLSWNLDNRPLLFETMILTEDEIEEEAWRYYTEAEAVAGHESAVEGLLARGYVKTSPPRMRAPEPTQDPPPDGP